MEIKMNDFQYQIFKFYFMDQLLNIRIKVKCNNYKNIQSAL